jgi:hypothetical protein
MMRSTFAVITVLSAFAAIGANTPVAAEPSQGSASDLRLSEEETIEPFEYDSDELDQLSTQINHSVDVDAHSPQRIRVTRPSEDFDLPSNLVIIDSNNNPAVGREVPIR